MNKIIYLIFSLLITAAAMSNADSLKNGPAILEKHHGLVPAKTVQTLDELSYSKITQKKAETTQSTLKTFLDITEKGLALGCSIGLGLLFASTSSTPPKIPS